MASLVLGGSGKTSFINLAREELGTRADILDFNPWMFSGAEQLVQSFFVEIAAQLKVRPGLADVGEDLQNYGEALSGLGWLPLVGPWIERGRGATKLLGQLLKRRREGATNRRDVLREKLSEVKRPIVVVLDDIDRLSTPEIRDVFRLVRLTASFPNLIYIVAFDRARVETALGDEGVPGRDYLEKILQLAIDLPSVPEDSLIEQTVHAIDDAVRAAGIEIDIDESTWPDVFMEVIRPLIRNMRDVRRYALAIRTTVEDVGERVQLVDVLALEALRVFQPDVFAAIRRSVAALTTPSSLLGGSREAPDDHKHAIVDLIESAGERRDVATALVKRLFPAAGRYVGESHYGPDWSTTWLRARRVANGDILRFYLERVAGTGLQAFDRARRAFELLGDETGLDEYLRSTDPTEVQDVVSSLENFEKDFQEAHVVPGTTVLLNLLPDIPDRPRGMFELETRMVIGRVTYRLIRSLRDPARVAAAVETILPRLATVSAKFELITDVGYRDGAGHKLVTPEAAADFERAWRDDVRALDVGSVANEFDLLRVLYWTRTDASEDEPSLEIPTDPTFTLAVLRSARSEARSQRLGTRSVRREPRLAWDTLVDVYGGDEALHGAIDRLLVTDPDEDQELFDLAKRYRSGWRPPQFGTSADDDS